MSAEFKVTFADPAWASLHQDEIIGRLEGLPTFVGRSEAGVRLRGNVDGGAGRLPYDVRLFLDSTPHPLLEISAHPPSIEHDLRSFFSWLRSRTPLQVLDEDGEESSW